MMGSEKARLVLGDGAAPGQRGAAETYAQYVTRLRGELADLKGDQSLGLSKEWHAALADRIDAIETELKQLGEKPVARG
jgi:hypothetical protein